MTNNSLVEELKQDLLHFVLTHKKKSAARLIKESFERYEKMTYQEIIEDMAGQNVAINKKYLKTAMYRERKLKR